MIYLPMLKIIDKGLLKLPAMQLWKHQALQEPEVISVYEVGEKIG